MGGRCRPQFLAEQTAQQGDQGNADQGDTTASHELLHTLTLCGGVITADRKSTRLNSSHRN